MYGHLALTCYYSISTDCSAKCSFHGYCGKNEQCICDSGWTGAHCNIQTCIAGCVNGLCSNDTRLCVCYPGFYGEEINFSSFHCLDSTVVTTVELRQWKLHCDVVYYNFNILNHFFINGLHWSQLSLYFWDDNLDCLLFFMVLTCGKQL